jgi:hypothetical protein
MGLHTNSGIAMKTFVGAELNSGREAEAHVSHILYWKRNSWTLSQHFPAPRQSIVSLKVEVGSVPCATILGGNGA